MGAAMYIGPVMAHKVLNENGKMIYRISVRSPTPDDIQSPSETRSRLDFDEAVSKKLGPSMMPDDLKDDPDFTGFETPAFEPYEDEEVTASKMPDIDDVDYVDTYDPYGGAQVQMKITLTHALMRMIMITMQMKIILTLTLMIMVQMKIILTQTLTRTRMRKRMRMRMTLHYTVYLIRFNKLILRSNI
jgi:hypothetical protein